LSFLRQWMCESRSSGRWRHVILW